jgi:hypothetical protein
VKAFRLEAEVPVKGNRVDVGFSYRQLDAGETNQKSIWAADRSTG